MMEVSTSSEPFVVSDLETLKIVSNPLRLDIMERIEQANRDGKLISAKQLAGDMQHSLTKLYYHLKLLEKHGLIVVGETVLVSGIPEKRYRASAQRIIVDQNIFSQTGDREAMSGTILELVNHILDRTRNSFHQLAQANRKNEISEALKPIESHFSRALQRMTVPQAQEFHARLKDLVQEFEGVNPEPDGQPTHTFGLTTLFYPVLDDEYK